MAGISRGWIMVALLGASVAGEAPVSSQPGGPGGAAGRAWSPPAREAVEAYLRGDYMLAQQYCVDLLSRSNDSEVRRDAALVRAMCLLQMPARSDRVEGRSLLAQLTVEEPALSDDPECCLAYGIGQTAQGETTDAIQALGRAVDGFGRRGESRRQLIGLVWLARAWARHNEWEFTPPSLAASRPADAAAAAEVRWAKVESLRGRIAAIPDSQDALDEVDLVLAELAAGRGRDEEARRILSGLTLSPTLGAAGEDAVWRVAELAEQSGRQEEALSFYRRLAGSSRTEMAERARLRIRQLTQPQIRLECPASIGEGEEAAIRLSVRGSDQVQVEIRAVDVERWLSSPQTRGHEALLPVAGSVRAAWDLDTRPAESGGWWNSESLGTPLRFSAPAGAYVVYARGRAAEGGDLESRRLAIVSDLKCLCFVGRQTMCVWAGGRAGSGLERRLADGSESGRVWFWMQRSFVGVEASLTGNAARLAVPNEARVMRDRGWYCLVRCGEHLALCRGEISGNVLAEAAEGAIWLAGGPQTVQVGEKLRFGGVLGGVGLAGSDGAPESVELQVVDLEGKVLAQQSVSASPSGVVRGEFEIPAQLGASHVRVLAKSGAATLENLAGRLPIAISTGGDPHYRLRWDVPLQVSASQRPTVGRVWVEDWLGRVPAEAALECTADVRCLRSSTGKAVAPPSHYYLDGGPADSAGGMTFSLAGLDPDECQGGLLVQLNATVQGWEGWKGASQAEMYVLPDAAASTQPATSAPGPAAMSGAGPCGAAPPRVSACMARTAADAGIRVRWEGERQGRWVALLEAGDPLAVLALPDDSANGEGFIELASVPSRPMRVWVVNLTADGPRVPLVCVVQPDPDEVPRLELSGPGPGVWPGSTVSVVARFGSVPPAGTTMLARLVGMGGMEYGAGPLGDVAELPALPGASLGWSGADRAAAEVFAGALLDDPGRIALRDVLSGGETRWVEAVDVDQPQATLRVPVPAAPGVYSLRVLLRRPGGAMATGMVLVDARNGVHASLTAPARLAVGDRTVLTAVIVNDSSQPAKVAVRAEGGEGLHVEGVGLVGDSPDAGRTVGGDRTEISVPAASRTRVEVRVEAACVGRGTAAVEITSGDWRSRALAGYLVEPSGEVSADATAVVLRRTLRVWTRCSDEDGSLGEADWLYSRCPGLPGESHVGVVSRRWRASDWTPATQLRVGQIIQVHEEFDLTQPFTLLTWQQTVPSIAALTDVQSAGTQAGPRRDATRRDMLLCRTLPLEARTHARDYFLKVVRPGVCCFPVPQWTDSQGPLPVRVEPGDLRLIAEEGP